MIFFVPTVVKYEEIKRTSVNKMKPCYSEHVNVCQSLGLYKLHQVSAVPQSIKSWKQVLTSSKMPAG